MFNIVITAGGIEEKIDSVRKITNTSTGKLGSIIANQIIESKNDKIEKIYYITTQNAIKPTENKKIKIIYVNGAYDLKEKITDILTQKRVDLFIHSMAVSDYTIDYITTAKLLAEFIENNNEKKVEEAININNNVLKRDKKISSTEENLIIKLKRTSKIISSIKEISPSTKLIGFKLLSNVSKEELYNAAYKQLEKNKCTLVVANDSKDINENRTQSYNYRQKWNSS
jgi:phosphopantothenate-cysteine ligase